MSRPGYGLFGTSPESGPAFLGTLLWYCHAPKMPGGRERVLPNGCMQIILNLSREYLIDCGEDGTAHAKHPRGIVVGVRDRYQVVDNADMEETAGAVIRPGGFTGLFRERSDLLFQKVIALEDIWYQPLIFEYLGEALTPLRKLTCLDKLLRWTGGKEVAAVGTTDHALYLLRVKHLSIAECARSIGISERCCRNFFVKRLAFRRNYGPGFRGFRLLRAHARGD